MQSHMDKPASAQRHAARVGQRDGTTPAARACRPARWAASRCLGEPAASDRANDVAFTRTAPVARAGLSGPSGYPWQGARLYGAVKRLSNGVKDMWQAGRRMKVRGRALRLRPGRFRGMSSTRECPATHGQYRTGLATHRPGAYRDHVAAKSATGFDSPSPTAHMRPSPDAGAFLLPASDGRSQPVQWRAVRGSRKARRSVGRSVNRVPSATPFDSGLADSTTYGVRTMNRSAIAAPAAIFPPSLHLPIEAPRDAWPALIERAASMLEGQPARDAETLALELRAIAEALRVEVAA